MLTFVKNYLTKKEGKNEYDKKLNEFLADGKLDVNEKEELEKMIKKYGLSKDDLFEAHKKACNLTFEGISSDKRITEEEKKALEELMNYFEISQADYKFDQKNFNKYYTLGLIDKGILPEVSQHNVEIIFKKGEILHWGCPASLNKFKRITHRITYGGPVASVKIIKGLRYRVGSVNYSTHTSEHLITEDYGPFWLTNQRVGFKGNRVHFSLPYSKIHAFELTKDGLFIFKENKEKPYIIRMDDYEAPCSIISFILNKD